MPSCCASGTPKGPKPKRPALRCSSKSKATADNNKRCNTAGARPVRRAKSFNVAGAWWSVRNTSKRTHANTTWLCTKPAIRSNSCRVRRRVSQRVNGLLSDHRYRPGWAYQRSNRACHASLNVVGMVWLATEAKSKGVDMWAPSLNATCAVGPKQRAWGWRARRCADGS